jgi:hypothetical protein
VELRSVVLRELWEQVSESASKATPAARGPTSLQRVEDTIHVCARGLVELLGAPATDRERCRSGCLESATSVLRAFARTPPTPADSQQPAARLLLSVDRRLTSREHSVLSGEKTYALDLDVLEQIAATTAMSPSVDDGDEARAADWKGVEQASVVLLLSAVRAVANIDSGGLAAAPSATAPTAVLRQLRVIIDQVDRSVRDLPKEPQRESDRTGRLLSEVLRMGLSKQAMNDLTQADAPSQARGEALRELRSVWLDVAARELEIVRILDSELTPPNYAQLDSLRQTVTAGAANVLVGGRLLDRPSDFLLLDALMYQHEGLAHAVEFYTAALRGHADAQTQTQLVVLTRLVRSVAALWIIDARLEQTHSQSAA